MFTGIIETTGILLSNSGGEIEVKLPDGWSIASGDSISISGVCLTVCKFSRGIARFDVSPETNKKTTLGKLRRGTLVNLERALQAGARFGGHIVTGHVDCVARLMAARKKGNSTMMNFSAPQEKLKNIAAGGAVALDGISLTVAGRSDVEFEVAVIPHTLKNTTLKNNKPGDVLNLETDILAKYVQNNPSAPAGRISENFLRENGFD
ncbi:MAG: riboflavin synthase [Elusimicrobia bacterium]|nr:riboflavin synthase [Elusimicrobiota bacterium]